jgi:ketosteroid isomerase-like protein
VSSNEDDVRQLKELVSRYAALVDTRQFDQLTTVFDGEGVLDSGRGVRTGMAEIVEAMQGLHRYETTDHQLIGHEFTFDPTDPTLAHGQVFCDAHHVSNDNGQRNDRIMSIRYDDRYRHTTQGWRIEHRQLNLLAEQTRRV